MMGRRNYPVLRLIDCGNIASYSNILAGGLLLSSFPSACLCLSCPRHISVTQYTGYDESRRCGNVFFSLDIKVEITPGVVPTTVFCGNVVIRRVVFNFYITLSQGLVS